jgi:hypothetical protein
MRRSCLAICLAVCIGTATLTDFTVTARADRPRSRPYGPVVMVAPAPAYYRHYAGPPTGRYGNPYYGLTNRSMFGPGPYYTGYGTRGVGYVYPPGFIGEPRAIYAPQGGRDWDPYSNPLLQSSMLENQMRWGNALPPAVPEARTRPRVRPSTPEQQVKSLHAQAQGDVWMKRLRFLNAYERYKVAQGAASDRPEPYFRLGISLAAVGSFDSAVKYLKQGLDLDPQWPAHGDHLDTLFGEENRLSVLSLIERVGGWAREDIRDPDRLFLMGVVLHFDGDSRSSEFFEAAYRLAGYGDHLLAFLHPAGGPGTPPMNGFGDQNFNGPNQFNGANPNGQMPPNVRPGRSNALHGPGGMTGPSAAPLPADPDGGPQPGQPGGPEWGGPQPGGPQPGGQMPAPPDFGPAGPPQGLFSPQQQPPRGLYQPDPQSQPPGQPNGQPRPQNGNWDPVPQLTPDVLGHPSRTTPSQPRPRQQAAPPRVNPTNPSQPSPRQSTPRPSAPQGTKPAAPLPVPPLPLPEESPVEPQSGVQNSPPAAGPELLLPPSTNGTTANSP